MKRDFSKMTREQLEGNYAELERTYNALHVEAAASAREATKLRAVVARVRDVLSDCSLDHSIDVVSAVEAVLPKEGT